MLGPFTLPKNGHNNNIVKSIDFLLEMHQNNLVRPPNSEFQSIEINKN